MVSVISVIVATTPVKVLNAQQRPLVAAACLCQQRPLNHGDARQHQQGSHVHHDDEARDPSVGLFECKGVAPEARQFDGKGEVEL